jgi:hypothetical protein
MSDACGANKRRGTRSTRALVGTVAAVALLTTAACTSEDNPASPSKAPVAATPSSTSSSSSKPPKKHHPKQHHKPAAHNPYTGIGPVPSRPVVSVKIDDTAPGRPQINIDKADIVYIEAVEGVLTRLAAIFGTNKPTVGYVRSTRPSDPDLLLQFGKLTAVYSGGSHDSIPRIHRSGIRSWSNDGGAGFFARVNNPDGLGYINLVIHLGKVAKNTKTTPPRPMGWTFDPSLKGLPTKKATDIRTEVTGSYSHGTPVEFRYDPKLHKYVRYIDGVRQVESDGKPVAATNVIVQSCIVKNHPQDVDVLGNPSQFTVTTGHGNVAVFRQGKRIDGTWSRHSIHHGTVLHTKGGKRLPLHPGNTWVVLVRNGIPVSS